MILLPAASAAAGGGICNRIRGRRIVRGRRRAVPLLEQQAGAVHAVPLVGARVLEPLAAEDVSKMPIARVAQDFHAAAVGVALLADAILYARPEPGPPAAAVELHPALVERCLAARAEVRAQLEAVIKTPSLHGLPARIGALIAQDAVLIHREPLLPVLADGILGPVGALPATCKTMCTITTCSKM